MKESKFMLVCQVMLKHRRVFWDSDILNGNTLVLLFSNVVYSNMTRPEIEEGMIFNMGFWLFEENTEMCSLTKQHLDKSKDNPLGIEWS